MISEKIIKISKAAIKSIIVAFLFVIIIGVFAITIGKEKFAMVTYILQIMTVNKNNVQTIEPVLEGGVLTNYPTYGTKYAVLKIPCINLEQPVYYGANYTILKNGVAHDETSYFPGEGGSIIYAGHNYSTFLADLPEVVNDEKIIVETSYGTFEYKVVGSKIIKETDTDEVPIQGEKEMLMIYTCWPINNIGHATERYVVYANLIK